MPSGARGQLALLPYPYVVRNGVVKDGKGNTEPRAAPLRHLTKWCHILVSVAPTFLLFLLFILRPNLLYFPRLLRLAFVHRVHRKRIAFQVQHPFTMQWLLIHGYLDTTPLTFPLSELRIVICTWAMGMLGAAYSTNVAGDGPRSEAARKRRFRVRQMKFHASIDAKRAAHFSDRSGSDPTVVPTLHFPPPLLKGTRSRPLQGPQPPPPPPLRKLNTSTTEPKVQAPHQRQREQ